MTSGEYVKFTNLFKKYYGDKFGNNEEIRLDDVKSFDPEIMGETFAALVNLSMSRDELKSEIKETREKLDLLEYIESHVYIPNENEGTSQKMAELINQIIGETKNRP